MEDHKIVKKRSEGAPSANGNIHKTMTTPALRTTALLEP
jgi:hypothetical protein